MPPPSHSPNPPPPPQSPVGSPAQNQTNGLAIAGLVAAFLIPLLGLILSVLGLKKSKELGGSGRGLAIAGLAISIFWMIVGVLIIVLVLIAAPALQRNARNTERRNDIGAIRNQLTTVFNDNNNVYPDKASFERDVLAQVEWVVYTDQEALDALPADVAVEVGAIYYINNRELDGAAASTEESFNADIAGYVLPSSNALHIIVGARCTSGMLAGGNSGLLGRSGKVCRRRRGSSFRKPQNGRLRLPA